ncbi:MAG: TIGR02300 family protein, partial [Pseudomonadota bacterium]|nr:TIGR02300 family protein [Pseudomonadota bacterium]
MAKPEWGKKRTCQNCGAKYYDLQKDPPTCPKCDTVFQVEQTTRGRRSRATAEAPKA